MLRKLSIKLSNLYLDLHNPRYEEQKSQNDALNTIASEQKGKLLVLLKDILENGLNPSDIPIVMPDPTRGNGYVVLEGNRRSGIDTAEEALDTDKRYDEAEIQQAA